MYEKKSIIILIILVIMGLNNSLMGQSIVKLNASAKLVRVDKTPAVSLLNFGTDVLTNTEGQTLEYTSISTGNNTVNISLMKASYNDTNTNATTNTLSEDRKDNYTPGAALNIQGNQVAGRSAGNFQVSVDYN
jgi:hypothetical protein